MRATPRVLLGLAVAILAIGGGPPATLRAADGSVDCGRTGMLDPAALACVEERFRACEPATWVVEINLGSGPLAQRWEIVGPREARCVVRTAYAASPNPDHPGKEMLCAFEPDRPFVEAVRDLRTCDGPLLDVLAGVGDEQLEFVLGRDGPRDLARTSLAGSIALTVSRPLRAEYLGREAGGYAVAIEHADDPACGRQELLLPARKAFRCGGVDYLLVVHPARSNDEQVVFALMEVLRA